MKYLKRNPVRKKLVHIKILESTKFRLNRICQAKKKHHFEEKEFNSIFSIN